MKNYLKNIGPSIKNSNFNSSSLDCFSFEKLSDQSSTINNNAEIWTIPKNYSLLTETFEKAKFEFIGKKLNFQRSQYNIKNGERWNVYQMYLKSLFNELKNLKILLKTQVEKIIFKNNYAKSVLVRNENGDSIEINANKEIILSAGTYGTPQILHLSGIGPKNVLDLLNIQPIVISPNVGKNLFEHLNLPLYVSINESASITFQKIMNPKEIWKYLTTGEGHFNNFGVLGNVRKIHENYGITIFGIGAIEETSFKSLSNFKTKVSTFLKIFYE